MASARLRGTTLSWTDSGAGEPVLFLHAFPLNGSMWKPQVQPGVRVIAPDARGFGASDEVPPTLGMDVIAEDAAALLASLGIPRAIVCGLSMGGYAALELWRRHPEIFRGLVLADTRAGADDAEGKTKREAFAKNALEKGEGWVATEMAPKLLRATSDPAVSNEVRAMIRASRPSAVAAASRGLAQRPDSFATLATITVPTLVLVGAEDAITPPAEAAKLAAGIRGAQLVEIPAAAHLSNLEAPAAFNAALLSFVQSLAEKPHHTEG